MRSEQRESFYVSGWCQDNAGDWGHAVMELLSGIIEKNKTLVMNIRVWNKATELNNHTAKSLKCSSVCCITATVLIKRDCLLQFHTQTSEDWGLFIQRWSNCSSSCGSELQMYKVLHMQHSHCTSVLTCKGAEVLASCDHLWIQRLSGSSFLRGAGGLAALYCCCLSCLNPLPVGHTGKETF